MKMAMCVTHETMKDTRIGFLKQMQEYIQFHIADEDAYARWIQIVPDEADEEDFEFIADNNDLWISACTTFGKITKEFEDR